MKVVFAGPSIHGLLIDWAGLERRPPAALGDLTAAVHAGAKMIGLIDGYFGWTASVWHKEILFALSHGVKVYGASSLGALRAAECAAFGMIPVGQIANAYLRGELDDDGDVALLHYPAEADYLPMTEPLVDMRATLSAMLSANELSPELFDQLLARAQALNFRVRTLSALFGGFSEDQAAHLTERYEQMRISVKANDALELIDFMRDSHDLAAPPSWAMQRSFPWKNAGLDRPARSDAKIT